MGDYEADHHSCLKCKLPLEENVYVWQEFKNGDKHIKCLCGKCGKYLGYVPKCEPYLSLIANNDIIQDLAYWRNRALKAEEKLEKLKGELLC